VLVCSCFDYGGFIDVIKGSINEWKSIHLYWNMFLFFRPETMIPDSAEECLLVDLDNEQEARRREYKNAYDEDEAGHGPSRVQCATH
jgi:hypothetical protein